MSLSYISALSNGCRSSQSVVPSRPASNLAKDLEIRPKDFNKNMRLNAIAHGYTLNEYGLFDEKEKMFKVNSEKDIFDLLGMEYITPDKR